MQKIGGDVALSFPHTPKGSLWAGALSYDLVQWTQPISLQHPPQEGEILAILWLVEEWIEEEVRSPEIPSPVRMVGETSSHTDEEHAQIVLRIKQSITAGDVPAQFRQNMGWALGEDPAQIFHS